MTSWLLKPGADDPHAVHRAIDVAAEGDLRPGGQLVEEREDSAHHFGMVLIMVLSHWSSWLVRGALGVRGASV